MRDHIKKLKKFKAPWWARLLGDFRAWKDARAARRRWYLIGTVNSWYDEYTHATGKTIQRVVYNHLWERGDGKRMVTFQMGLGARTSGYRGTHIYNTEILPWLLHKHNNSHIKNVAEASKIAP